MTFPIILLVVHIFAVPNLSDKGNFSEYDSKVQLKIPKSIPLNEVEVAYNHRNKVLYLYYQNTPVKIFYAVFSCSKSCKAKQPLLYKKFQAFNKSFRPRYPYLRIKLSTKSKDHLREAYLSKQPIFTKKSEDQPFRLSLTHQISKKQHYPSLILAPKALKELIEISKKTRRTKGWIDIKISKHSIYKDQDKDGIPNALDLLLGAKKLTHNKAKYKGSYVGLRYPMGDVPKTIGVCSDVIIRAMRNAGFDLQKQMHIHIKRNRRKYRWIKRPDRNIDHRRVKNMLVYFQSKSRLFRYLGKGYDKNSRKRYLPGDIVFMDTLPKKGPDHIGIITDQTDAKGNPFVINNWTYGYHTQSMSLLPQIPVTHHFRLR